MTDPHVDLRQFDLNLLVVLDALLTERHVTRAGQRLHLTQSATSAALRRLRRAFDDPLLVRHGSEMQPTPLGASLAVPVRAMLRDVDRMLGEATLPDDGLRDRTFVVQASEYVALLLLHPLIEVLGERAPGVRLRIEPLDETSSDRLRRDDIDLVFAPRHTVVAHRLQRFPHEALFTDELVVAVWDKHPDVADRITVDDLSRLPHLQHAVSGPEHANSLLPRELAAHDVEHTVQATTPSFTLLPFLLQRTRMVTFLPRLLAEAMRTPAQLRFLPSPVPLTSLVETMYWPPERDHGDPAHLWLRRQIHSLAAAYAREPGDAS
ncbi:LysR family transcriptional regulator [Streptomyces sp. YKOK-I1]